MPIWSFEPEGDDPADRDVLLSSGRLWGADVLIEAPRVVDDNPSPVPSVRDRFDRWAAAIGAAQPLSPVRLPGRAGCYVVFAFPGPL